MHAAKVSVAILLVLMINVFAFSLNSRCFAVNTVLSVTPTTYTANSMGENVSIQVRISQVLGLTEYQFTLSFNPALLKCLATQIGSFFPPQSSISTITVDNNQGTVSALFQLQTSQPASGNGLLLGVTFNATYGTPYPQQKASSLLGIVDDTLYAGNTAIPHTTLNATYVSPYIPPQINLSLSTGSSHHFEEAININGTLTGNGYPVTDALVALEIKNPQGTVVVGRTLSTSTIPGQLPLNIAGLTPCTPDGTPQNSFTIGNIAHFKITVQNLGTQSYSAVLMVNVYDSSNAPIGIYCQPANFGSGQTDIMILGFPIESLATSGNAVVYASVLSGLVENGGTPLSLENQATFTISGSAQGTPVSTTQPPRGSYGTALRIHYSAQSNSTGNFTVYVATTYMGNKATQSGQLQITVGGDVNKDGTVNLIDLVLLALAYGSKPGDANWNAKADINGDGRVGLNDLVILAQNYGKNTNP
jgi:hypothetical protein